MSFSSGVKTELCRLPISRTCCTLAECYGVLLYCNTFTPREIRVVTSSPDFAGRLNRLFHKAFSFGFDDDSAQKGGKKHCLSISSPEKIAALFAAFGYEVGGVLAHHINLAFLEEPCCATAFIRGAFLAGGSMTDPSKGYHLELSTVHLSVSRELFSLLIELGFEPKDTCRGGSYITYFKHSGAIEDLFTLLGAPVSAMEIMNAKVEKDMRNTINRKVNCDNANADKIVSASMNQLQAIKKLNVSELPPKLRDTALLRIANPEASLAELSALSVPPVTKSCLSHRLRKLMELAEDIRDG
jgi:DNA-binding protein WhiA